MKKAMMLLAFVGGIFLTNAQEEAKLYTGQKIERTVKSGLVENATLAAPAKLTQRTITQQDNYSHLKDILRDKDGMHQKEEMIDLIYTNPEMRSYIKSNRHLLYRFGLTPQDVTFLNAYLNSNTK